jgi:hypothetical protein
VVAAGSKGFDQCEGFEGAVGALISPAWDERTMNTP